MTSTDAAQVILLRRNLSDSIHKAYGVPCGADQDLTFTARFDRIRAFLEIALADGNEADPDVWIELGSQVIAGLCAADRAEVVRVDTGTEAA